MVGKRRRFHPGWVTAPADGAYTVGGTTEEEAIMAGTSSGPLKGGDDLVAAMALIDDADSVELKLTIPTRPDGR